MGHRLGLTGLDLFTLVIQLNPVFLQIKMVKLLIQRVVKTTFGLSPVANCLVLVGLFVNIFYFATGSKWTDILP